MKAPHLLSLLKRVRQVLEQQRRRGTNQHSGLMQELDMAIGYHEALESLEQKSTPPRPSSPALRQVKGGQ